MKKAWSNAWEQVVNDGEVSIDAALNLMSGGVHERTIVGMEATFGASV